MTWLNRNKQTDDTMAYTQADVRKFIEIFDECETSEEFSVMCALAGYGDWATKKFFNERIFEFLYTPAGRAMHGESLRIQIYLRRKITKLQMMYNNLVDEL